MVLGESGKQPSATLLPARLLISTLTNRCPDFACRPNLSPSRVNPGRASVNRNVILIAHECVTTVPNPNGEDWMRYEPRLQCPNSGKAAVRLRLKEWADHVLFLGYDVAVDKDGKGKGSGTRTLYPCELPFCMAKSRTTQTPLVVEDGKTLWANIIK